MTRKDVMNMAIIFDVGVIATIIAIIGAFIFIAANMGIDGICQVILENPEKTIFICTLILFVISIIVCCILSVGQNKTVKSFFRGICWSVPLTLGLSASTIFNIYNTVYAVQSLHETVDLAIRIIFFIIPLLLILFLIILYIVSYVVGLSTIILYTKFILVDEKSNRTTEVILRMLAFAIPVIIYVFVSWNLLNGNNTIFTILT